MFIAKECALLPTHTICDSHLFYYIHVANPCDVDSQANTFFSAFVCIGVPCQNTSIESSSLQTKTSSSKEFSNSGGTVDVQKCR